MARDYYIKLVGNNSTSKSPVWYFDPWNFVFYAHQPHKEDTEGYHVAHMLPVSEYIHLSVIAQDNALFNLNNSQLYTVTLTCKDKTEIAFNNVVFIDEYFQILRVAPSAVNALNDPAALKKELKTVLMEMGLTELMDQLKEQLELLRITNDIM